MKVTEAFLLVFVVDVYYGYGLVNSFVAKLFCYPQQDQPQKQLYPHEYHLLPQKQIYSLGGGVCTTKTTSVTFLYYTSSQAA